MISVVVSAAWELACTMQFIQQWGLFYFCLSLIPDKLRVWLAEPATYTYQTTTQTYPFFRPATGHETVDLGNPCPLWEMGPNVEQESANRKHSELADRMDCWQQLIACRLAILIQYNSPSSVFRANAHNMFLPCLLHEQFMIWRCFITAS